MPARRYVLTARAAGAERTVAVDEAAGRPGAYVLEDVTAGRQLGELRGDATPFLVDLGGEPHVLLAGWVEPRDRVHHVAIEVARPGRRGHHRDEQLAKTGNDVWISFPVPFEPGMVARLTWHGAEPWSASTQPLTTERLDPVYGPRWVPGFSPTDAR